MRRGTNDDDDDDEGDGDGDESQGKTDALPASEPPKLAARQETGNQTQGEAKGDETRRGGTRLILHSAATEPASRSAPPIIIVVVVVPARSLDPADEPECNLSSLFPPPFFVCLFNA